MVVLSSVVGASAVAVGTYHFALGNLLLDGRPTQPTGCCNGNVEVLVSKMVEIHLPVSEPTFTVFARNVLEYPDALFVLSGKAFFPLSNLGNSGGLVCFIPRFVVRFLTSFTKRLLHVALHVEGVKWQIQVTTIALFHTLKDYCSFKVTVRSGAAPGFLGSKPSVLADILSDQQTVRESNPHHSGQSRM